MENRDKNIDREYTGRGEYNQRLGRELYQRDHDPEHPEARHHDRRHTNRKWDEGNYFHTGPSERGAQDSGKGYYSSGTGSSSYHEGQHAHMQDHYGSRRDSPYRNERSYLDHGTHGFSKQQPYSQGSRNYANPGNYNERPDAHDNIYREGPGSRSRYKEDDYRYGSGSHNWYREGRYTPDEDRSRHDDRGFFERAGDAIRNTWNDIMHADDADYQRRHYRPHHEKGSDRVRMGSEPYRDRQQFNRGYEGGPRWADESDTGHDNRYDDTDRTHRYRR
ncbi:hypothetical protein [Botryobacter ruber]|uniref:hypothetical protein n=1 Tax=Botryobacter ruber TaxID=2171629 RepID=UPI000E0C213D|nr:hypothetical protein [Botryobacter ruber]